MAERLSYEDARAQLVEVVQRLEAGGTTICQEWLDGARKRLETAQNSAS
jgi:exodeoxyribonuclease VII small subunit